MSGAKEDGAIAGPASADFTFLTRRKLRTAYLISTLATASGALPNFTMTLEGQPPATLDLAE